MQLSTRSFKSISQGVGDGWGTQVQADTLRMDGLNVGYGFIKFDGNSF